MIAAILAASLANADPSTVQLYLDCLDERPACYAYLAEVQASARICGPPMSDYRMGAAYVYGLDRQPERIHMPVREAAAAAIHDMIGCTADDLRRQASRR